MFPWVREKRSQLQSLFLERLSLRNHGGKKNRLRGKMAEVTRHQQISASKWENRVLWTEESQGRNPGVSGRREEQGESGIWGRTMSPPLNHLPYKSYLMIETKLYTFVMVDTEYQLDGNYNH